MRRSITLALFVLAAILPANVPAAEGIRLGRGVVPVRELVELDLDAAQSGYTGKVTIDLTVNEAAQSFRFHAQEMQLESLVLSGAGSELQLTTSVDAEGTVTASAPRPLAPGDYVLTIEFANEFDTRAVGLYRMETGGQAYIFTQFEAVDARKAFPCWDEPAFKIPYQLQLTVPAAHLAVTNTPVERETAAGEKKTILFKATPPLPSYLLAIAAGPLETAPIPGLSVPGRMVTVKGYSELTGVAAAVVAPVLAELERYFGRPYPFEKLDCLAVPEFWPGAMENPGAVTFAEPLLVIDPAQVSFQHRCRLIETVAHELAHMWVGDLVTMDWWDDLWLNEAFASWIATKVSDAVLPEARFAITSVQGTKYAMTTDAMLTARAIRQPITDLPNLLQSADELTYSKGEALLSMVEHWIGEDAFRQGVRSYLNAHAWGNAVGADLWTALSASAGSDVGAVMSSFLDRPGVPVVSAELLPDRRIRLTQERFLHHGAENPDPGQLWRIPVVLRYPDAGGMGEQRMLLIEKTQTFPLETAAAPAWIHPNAGEQGYYRWKVDPAILHAVAAKAPQLLDVRERLGLLGNISALLDAGSLRGDEYLQALAQFADDPEPEVIRGLTGEISGVRYSFVTDDLEEAFAVYVRRTLRPALGRIGMQRADGEQEAVSLTRSHLLAHLGDFGRDGEVLDFAEAQARAYLENPAAVDPALAGAVLSLAAIRGDRALFDAYRAKFESARLPGDRQRYLDAMGSFRDPAIVADAMRYTLEDQLRPQELYIIPMTVGSHPPFQDLHYQWATEHYDAITSRIPPEFAVYMPYAAGGCSEERLAAAMKFFSEPGHSPPGTAIELAKVAEEVSDCVDLRRREGEAVRTYLLGVLAGEAK